MKMAKAAVLQRVLLKRKIQMKTNRGKAKKQANLKINRLRIRRKNPHLQKKANQKVMMTASLQHHPHAVWHAKKVSTSVTSLLQIRVALSEARMSTTIPNNLQNSQSHRKKHRDQNHQTTLKYRMYDNNSHATDRAAAR